MTIAERHVEMVRAVNDAKTEHEHREADCRLEGYIQCMEDLGCNIGMHIMAADAFYLDQGIDRPMCGGVWLDWKPSPDAPKGGET